MVDAGAGASAAIPVLKTNSWDDYHAVSGVLKVATAGDHPVMVRAADSAAWKPMNLAAVALTKAP